MELIRLCGVLALLSAMLAFPETTLNAAREAMQAWYMTVAPALFPFMALMPMLTAPAAAAVWERLLGRWMRPVMNLPGCAAPAVAAAMIAGSPAGAAAVAACPGLTRSERERLTGCLCGLSPAFLVTGVGAGMLGSAAEGHLLLRAQLLAQLTLLLLTRRMGSDGPVSAAEGETGSVRAAVTAVLTVCGYMMLYGVAGALISRLCMSARAGLAALCLLDAPSACRALAEASMERTPRLLLLAGVTGFGGACISAQNLAAARKSGVRAGKYFRLKAAHAALCTAFAALQMRFCSPESMKNLPPLEFSALLAAIFSVPALISLEKDLFLNKRKFGKTRRV